MSSYIAKDGERLDWICYWAYGTLDCFNIVLEANPNLLELEVLRAGDTVFLPEWNPPKEMEAKPLW